ncbi:putative inactive serine/threonine-protein kinase bub1 [Camellia lanceoleosa]|uniref:Inactive serine/threonine-protein kinase bub1 n=1 Tax=Camellia lanceoleosa TaxID=1840588 RepID=A0ACC0J0Y5_9ERIC|nr:putative inactive serine/threonine-protein kinase bub1 [Camellia lanceoleosa]
MSNSNSNSDDELFSSLISDIKTYTGKDPLLPWLRGIRKMRDSLPPLLLKEKLPRFLQKCAQTFQTDRRYTNDLRYFRVWLQLMDFVDDPRAVLSTMEANRIGMKKSLFYQAFALYYEKLKNFEEADKMYHLGVQNLAEPIDELQKSYEQFLHRMERHKKKKMQCQERTRGKGLLRVVSLPPKCNEAKRNNEKSLPETQPNHENVEVSSDSSLKKGVEGDIRRGSFLNRHDNNQAESDEPNNFCGDDTVVVRFLGTAIAGQSEAEDACHHGLVEPTINTKEALNAINSMFREPLEPAHFNRRSHKSNKPKADQRLDKGFEVFVDENLDEAGSSNQNGEKGFEPLQHNRVETNQILQEPLQIYIDDEESNEVEERINVKDDLEESKVQQLTEHVNAFVFPSPNDLDTERSPRARLREDTVVCRFVGSTISDEPQVENVCHHGLVEPTINLKEAMDDINSMFGKPIDFVRANRRKKQDKAPYNSKNNCEGFLILPDDDLGHQRAHSRPSPTPKNDGLFEQTVCTKEAMDEINKMFGMPLDF